jgi:hypothetical protein
MYFENLHLRVARIIGNIKKFPRIATIIKKIPVNSFKDI